MPVIGYSPEQRRNKLATAADIAAKEREKDRRHEKDKLKLLTQQQAEQTRQRLEAERQMQQERLRASRDLAYIAAGEKPRGEAAPGGNKTAGKPDDGMISWYGQRMTREEGIARDKAAREKIRRESGVKPGGITYQGPGMDAPIHISPQDAANLSGGTISRDALDSIVRARVAGDKAFNARYVPGQERIRGMTAYQRAVKGGAAELSPQEEALRGGIAQSNLDAAMKEAGVTAPASAANVANASPEFRAAHGLPARPTRDASSFSPLSGPPIIGPRPLDMRSMPPQTPQAPIGNRLTPVDERRIATMASRYNVLPQEGTPADLTPQDREAFDSLSAQRTAASMRGGANYIQTGNEDTDRQASIAGAQKAVADWEQGLSPEQAALMQRAMETIATGGPAKQQITENLAVTIPVASQEQRTDYAQRAREAMAPAGTEAQEALRTLLAQRAAANAAAQKDEYADLLPSKRMELRGRELDMEARRLENEARARVNQQSQRDREIADTAPALAVPANATIGPDEVGLSWLGTPVVPVPELRAKVDNFRNHITTVLAGAKDKQAAARALMQTGTYRNLLQQYNAIGLMGSDSRYGNSADASKLAEAVSDALRTIGYAAGYTFADPEWPFNNVGR